MRMRSSQLPDLEKKLGNIHWILFDDSVIKQLKWREHVQRMAEDRHGIL